MLNYIGKRIALSFIVVLGVIALIFIISHLLPANPAKVWAGIKSTDEQVKALQKQYHLDEPVLTQFGYYLGQLIHGDLGMSPLTHHPVLDDLKRFTPATLELLIFSLLAAILIGMPLGIISAIKRGSVVDHSSRVIALSGVSLPSFWLGLLLQLAFFFKLGWLPATGRISSFIAPPSSLTGFYIIDSVLTRNSTALFSSLQHLILPAICLSLYPLAMLARIVRASLLETLSHDYIKTAQAKGLSYFTVIYKHALRNSLSAALTIMGMTFVYSLGGAVVVETVFAWPGIGRYASGALTAFDFPALMGFTLLVGTGTALVNLVVDLLYGALDPRIRY